VTTTDQSYALSADQLQQFDEQGYIILRDVIPAAALERVQEVFESVVERLATTWYEEGLITETYADLPFAKRFAALRAQLPSRFPTSWRKAMLSEAVYDLWQLPQLTGPVRSLAGDELYAHGVWNGRPREPHTSVQKVLWHQDAHYYKGWDKADGTLISVWMPLVPVDAPSGCLQLLEGSQRKGYVERVRGANGLFTVRDEELEGFPVITAAMQPGDALFFSDLTLHQALANEADYVRWSIDIRFGSATPQIIDKTPRGYYCYSASDPSRVESFEQWADRYDYSAVGLEAELENLEEGSYTDLNEVAKQLQISRSELEVF
jgi:ectoine hydroxylase-related dioxygenase (phytanoyl-CoA dioxygenase family)